MESIGKSPFQPKLEGIDSKIQQVKQQLPVSVWLLGKTQSGKTSVIRAFTSNDMAEIGIGNVRLLPHHPVDR